MKTVSAHYEPGRVPYAYELIMKEICLVFA